MPDTLPTLTSSLEQASKDAAAKLLADLKAQGATDIAAATAFADKFGPISAKWAFDLARAILTGDAAGVAAEKDNLADLAALTAETGADMGVLVQSASEADGKAFVDDLLAAAMKAGIAALVTV